jgi:biopolymer transport protein ExbB/TolQ
MKGYKQLVVAGIVILAVAVVSGAIGYGVGKGSAKAWELGKRQWAKIKRADFPAGLSRAEKIERFKRLYHENPEEFKKTLGQREQMLRQRLARLKEEDPEKYKEAIQKHINRLETTLERLRQELPETTK